MKKQKPWHIAIIIVVAVLTLYNILPTIFYYSKPLSAPVGSKEAHQISTSMLKRVNSLEQESEAWLSSFARNLKIKPKSIQPVEGSPQLIEVSLKNEDDADTFKKYLPIAGSLISFVPAQLSLSPQTSDMDPSSVLVERHIGLHFNPDNVNKLLKFTPKKEHDMISPLYRNLIYDRLAEIALALGGRSPQGTAVAAIVDSTNPTLADQEVLALANEIVEFEKSFGSKNPITHRFYATFTQADQRKGHAANVISALLSQMERTTSHFNNEIGEILEKENSLKQQGKYLQTDQQYSLQALKHHKDVIESAKLIVKHNQNHFEAGLTPLHRITVLDLLKTQASESTSNSQEIVIGNHNPFINSISIDWENETLKLHLHDDVSEMLHPSEKSEHSALLKEKDSALLKEKVNQLLINRIAYVAQKTNEKITPKSTFYSINLNKLTNSRSLLIFDLAIIAKNESQRIHNKILNNWNPELTDFSANNFPVWDLDTYNQLPTYKKKLGLVVYSPIFGSEAPSQGFRTSSIYVVAKGLAPILKKYSEYPDSEESKLFQEDFDRLRNLLQQEGFQLGYMAASYGTDPEYHQDYIFEYPDYYGDILAATREDFSLYGNKRFAVLEFTDIEQRILVENKIADQIQGELLKWRDNYQAAQVDLDLAAKYNVPPPTKNIFFSNLAISLNKYFRGDNRKIIKWGLDLSGGKTVRIGLRDQNNRPVTDKADLTEGVNELTRRVNKMGLSEVSSRIEGNSLVLDFPASQGISAGELIKASSMYFHVVNEQFTNSNPVLAKTIDRFLQDIWNEAVVTNRRDVNNLNLIAWQHLGGSDDGLAIQPRTEHAKILYNSGLRLSHPDHKQKSGVLNDTLSAISVFQGDDLAAWQGQSTPLLIVFDNYALEGSELDNIRTGYDPTKGNILSFSVKGSYSKKNEEKINPRELLYAWTSQFSQEKVIGTSLEAFSKGRGWRMAVILNDRIINSPVLSSPLRDHVQVSGGFTQTEVNKLSADLKAGSLSFTPQILSEENVSPELGHKEREQGITATIVALCLVVLVMVIYYRFGGFIASIAVIFNLLIIWATLQNLQATLSLAGIAGIILTLGMAVDANVLVFERIREEFMVSKRITSAVKAGYRKAFSAILDSNITTIIAALILLNFDSGPIKGFAITLIVGIISSMFTALFMTRTFFMRWVQKSDHKELKMLNFIKSLKFNFLGKTKIAYVISLGIIILGCVFISTQKNSILGMDFTGGYSFTLNLKGDDNSDFRKKVSEAFIANGAQSGDFEIRELNRDNHLRIQLGMSMEEKGHPFYQLSYELDSVQKEYAWQNNPRILWVVNAINDSNLTITPTSLAGLDTNWVEMSGQLSKTMRNNALIGLTLALFFILIYITFRFELKYAISAIICILHDVLITVGAIAILHQAGVAIQINLQVIAAIMTIIGYSLNDTIIIFDRIREENRIMRKSGYSEVINHALRVTLNRTLMTSFTTLVVLLTLVFLGGNKVFDFSLVMTIGVVFGTLSSLFIAPPILMFFHKKEKSKEAKTFPIKKNSFS